MMDGIETLSKVSGLGKNEVGKIWEEVKANQKCLRECEGPHDFEKEGEGLRAEYRCRKCKGKVRVHEYGWYMEGLKHGRAST